jgi:alpha-mannosidase
VLLSAKPAEDGNGLILRLENLRREPQRAAVRLHVGTPASASLTTPIEVDVRDLEVSGDVVIVPLEGLAFETVRVVLAA